MRLGPCNSVSSGGLQFLVLFNFNALFIARQMWTMATAMSCMYAAAGTLSGGVSHLRQVQECLPVAAHMIFASSAVMTD